VLVPDKKVLGHRGVKARLRKGEISLNYPRNILLSLSNVWTLLAWDEY